MGLHGRVEFELLARFSWRDERPYLDDFKRRLDCGLGVHAMPNVVGVTDYSNWLLHCHVLCVACALRLVGVQSVTRWLVVRGSVVGRDRCVLAGLRFVICRGFG